MPLEDMHKEMENTKMANKSNRKIQIGKTDE
jgi:hypothetical protein